VGVAFVLPSFIMVLGLSAAYVRFGGLPWMQGMFYGIGAGVIGIIARSAFKLTKLTLGKDKLLWAVFVLLAVSRHGPHRNHLALSAGRSSELVGESLPLAVCRPEARCRCSSCQGH